MYCRKCNNLMMNDETVCPNCGFDNTEDFQYATMEIELNNSSNKKKNNIKSYIFIIVVLILTLTISLYVFFDTKTGNKEKINDSKQETTILDEYFTFHDVKVKYPRKSYGTSTNTIFYKNNNNYKIEFKQSNEEEYKNLNKYDLLASKLGNIETMTYNTEDGYNHIFTLNNQYYLIQVSYDEQDNLESLERQLELTKIINTLEEK